MAKVWRQIEGFSTWSHAYNNNTLMIVWAHSKNGLIWTIPLKVFRVRYGRNKAHKWNGCETSETSKFFLKETPNQGGWLNKERHMDITNNIITSNLHKKVPNPWKSYNQSIKYKQASKLSYTLFKTLNIPSLLIMSLTLASKYLPVQPFNTKLNFNYYLAIGTYCLTN